MGMIGSHHSDETKLKMRLTKLGKKMSDEARKKMSIAKTGTKAHPRTIEALRRTHTGNKYCLGKKHTDEWRAMMSQKMTGRKMPRESVMRGAEKRKAMCRERGGWMSPEGRVRWREKMVGRPLTEEHIRKCLKRKDKSSLEVSMEEIIADLNLPYKFVGNGEFLIGRKCPDFINTNGEKIALEVFHKKHKEAFRGISLSEWMQSRRDKFAEYGWSIEFFDASRGEVTRKVVAERLGEMRKSL